MFDTIKTELLALASTRLAWFLAGAYLAGHDVAAIVASLRTFVGL